MCLAQNEQTICTIKFLVRLGIKIFFFNLFSIFGIANKFFIVYDLIMKAHETETKTAKLKKKIQKLNICSSSFCLNFCCRAAAGLNGVEFDGGKLHAESLEKQRRGPRNRGQYPALPGGGGPGRQTDFPLRLLVQSDMVGAIIGRQGSTIRQITQQSRARVDVHRKDNVGSLEKAITIYGNPENCTNACKRILEVMQQEAVNTNKG